MPAIPLDGFLAPPGQYAARLTVDGKGANGQIRRPGPTRESKPISPPKTEFAAKLRDDFAKLAGTVQQLRGRPQAVARSANDLVAGDVKTKDVVKASAELIGKTRRSGGKAA